jgi:polysaccharide export outer membrane protein
MKNQLLPWSQAIAVALGLSLAAPLSAIAQSTEPAPTDSPNLNPAGRFEILEEELPRLVEEEPELVPTATYEQFSSADYVLGSGDQIAVTVFGYEEFEGSRVVLPDGTISVPLVGAVQASGITVEGLAQDLTNRLRPYLVDPVVDVSLTVLRPIVVNVAGEVHRPGPVQLSSLTDVRTRVDTDSRITSSSTAPTLSTAITSVGGVRRTANIREIVLQRTLVGNETATIEVNLWEALLSASAPSDPILRDGDTIFVPEMTAADIAEQRLVASSTFAPELVRVRVVGEVEAPGPIEVPPDSSLSAAIAIAGGPTEDSELDEVSLVRLNDDGQVEERKLDLEDLVDNFQVQEGDVIFVPQEDGRSFLDFVPRLLGPVGDLLDIFDFF